ncbi:MAG: phosphoserine phosphatase SerB [Pseudomonadota bacterium]
MERVLTLVGAAGASLPSPDWVDRLRQSLDTHGVESEAQRWLAPGLACDMKVAPKAEALGPEVWMELLQSVDLDWALLPAHGRRKKLLLADMESTIITQEMIDELAEAAGLGPEIADVTRRAMAGEMAFAGALRERVARFSGLSVALLQQISHRITFNPGAKTLVGTMAARGAYCALVSGGFSFFTAQVRETCGFHEDRANELIVEDGRITGRVREPILGPEAKERALQELVAKRNLTADEVCAVGDGANDLEMLAAAGLGVAFHGKPAVRAAARFRVDHGDLTSLLYFQGYHRDEFVVSR